MRTASFLRPACGVLTAAAAALTLCLCCSAAEAPELFASVADGASGDVWMLTDSNRTTKRSFPSGAALTVTLSEPAASLYLVWDAPPPENGWILSAHGLPDEIRSTGFLHEYVPLSSPCRQLTVSWDGAATLCDIVVFGAGDTPDWVQVWRPAEGCADLLLLPTHADDEHLFFGGILPLYIDRGYEVQVAYMVNHNTEPYRPHEQLNGLWTAGVRRYPVIPDFPDLYSDSLEHAKTVYDEQALLDYQTGLLLRFTPQVVVGHDLNGEYGHGAHMLCARTLLRAVESAAALPDGWDTPKTYLHLYPEQTLVLDYGAPLLSFGGKIAFEIACEGFSRHISQQTYFSVEQSGPYDCRKFGLARTSVGPDERRDDLFEHLTARARQPADEREPEETAPAAAQSAADAAAHAASSASNECAVSPQTREGLSLRAAAAAFALFAALSVALFLWRHVRPTRKRR